MRLRFAGWLAWTEEKSPYLVHVMKGEDELVFPANDLDRLIEVLIRLSNSFYPEKAQVHVENYDDE